MKMTETFKKFLSILCALSMLLIGTPVSVLAQSPETEAAPEAVQVLDASVQSEPQGQTEEERKAEADRLAKEEADRLAKEEADRLAKEEADRLAKEEADRLTKEEADRLAKEEADRLAKEEADRLAKEEADRLAKEEADRLAREEADRLAKEEADRLAKEEADRLAKEEADRLAKAEADRLAKEEADRLAKEEADRLAKEEADRLAKEEADRLAKEEADRLTKEEAEKQKQEEQKDEENQEKPRAEEPTDQKTGEAQNEEMVHPDATIQIGQSAGVKIDSGKAYIVRLISKTTGKIRIQADAEFPIRMEVTDEETGKTREFVTAEDGTFDITFSVAFDHSYLLTLSAKENGTGEFKVATEKVVPEEEKPEKNAGMAEQNQPEEKGDQIPAADPDSEQEKNEENKEQTEVQNQDKNTQESLNIKDEGNSEGKENDTRATEGEAAGQKETSATGFENLTNPDDPAKGVEEQSGENLKVPAEENPEVPAKENPLVDQTVTLEASDIRVSAVSEERLNELLNIINPPMVKKSFKKAKSLQTDNTAAPQSTAGDNSETATGYVAFDISLTNAELNGAGEYVVPVTLGSPVDMLEGKDNAAADHVTFTLYHIHTDEDGNITKEEISEGEQLQVQISGSLITGFTVRVDNFSDFVLKYTVDFHYNGVDYSIPGESQMLLTELIRELNIMNPNSGEALDCKDVARVEFTDERLVTVKQVAGLIRYFDGEKEVYVDAGEKDFLLSSIAPFTSDEELTIWLEEGFPIGVGVTDGQCLGQYTVNITGENAVKFSDVFVGISTDSFGIYPSDIQPNPGDKLSYNGWVKEVQGFADIAPGETRIKVTDFSGGWNWYEITVIKSGETPKYTYEITRFDVGRQKSLADILTEAGAESLYSHYYPRCSDPTWRNFYSVDTINGDKTYNGHTWHYYVPETYITFDTLEGFPEMGYEIILAFAGEPRIGTGTENEAPFILILKPKKYVTVSDSVFTYTIENEKAVITGFRDEDNDPAEIVVPDKTDDLVVDGKQITYPIIGIDKAAFANKTRLTDLTITARNSDFLINEEAFKGCSGLKKFFCSANEITVEKNAFAGCTALETVVFNGAGGGKNLKKNSFTGATNLQVLLIDNTYNVEKGAFAPNAGKQVIITKDSAMAELPAKTGQFETYIFKSFPYWIGDGVLSGDRAPKALYIAPTVLLNDGVVSRLAGMIQSAGANLRDVYIGVETLPDAWMSQLSEANSNVLIHLKEYKKEKGFYLDGTSGDDATATGTAEQPYGTFEKLKEAYELLTPEERGNEKREKDPFMDKVNEAYRMAGINDACADFYITTKYGNLAYIMGTVTITENTEWDGGNELTLYRAPGFSDVMIRVKDSVAFSLSQIVLDGSKLDDVVANAPMIETAGSLTLGNGSKLQNAFNTRRGGAIHAKGGTITILDGSEIKECQAQYGGGIYAEKTTVALKGGTLKDNHANDSNWRKTGGGAVCLNNNASMIMSGGIVSGNGTNGCGGGLAIGGLGLGSATYFEMAGGQILDNESGYMGGGIYIHSKSEADITSGYIAGNKAAGNILYCYSGGGIYVEKGAELRLKNVVVKNNQANNGYGGGGIAACGTADVSLYLNNGGAVFNNTYGKNPDDLALVGMVSQPNFYVSPVMLGGGAYLWTSNFTEDEYGRLLFYKDEFPANYLEDRDKVYMVSHASRKDQDIANRLAQVVIESNTAGYCGGGVATNGSLIIGTDPGRYELTVAKTWSGDVASHRPTDYIDFKVLGTPADDPDSEKTYYGMIRLTPGRDSNGDLYWPTLTVDTFPAIINGRHMRYTVEENIEALNAKLDGAVYSATYSDEENERTITVENTEIRQVSATKEWDDQNDQDGLRKDVTLHLIKSTDGIRFMDVEGMGKVIPAGATGEALKVTWDKLPKYENETEILYAVTEDPIKGYTTAITGDMTAGYSVVNTHIPVTGETELKVAKTITGRSFRAGDRWTFTVTADEDTPMPEKTELTIMPGSGTTAELDFGKIAYGLKDDGKTYTYTITETGTVAGVTNDTAKTVTVTVADNGDGTLKMTSSADSTPVTFVNTYRASGSTELNAVKTISKRAFRAGDRWTFTVTATEGAPMPERSSVTIEPKAGESYDIGFGTIRYTEADAGKTYTYTITESGAVEFVENDTAKTVTVTVTDDGSGTLQVSNSQNETPTVFVNTYTAPAVEMSFSGTKTMTGRAMTAADVFSFDLRRGEELLQTVQNDAAGNISFSPVAFTEADINRTYRFTVSEQANAIPGVGRDETVYETTVTVLKNAEGKLELVQTGANPEALNFVNPYTAEATLTLGAVKLISGRSFRAGDSWIFTVTGPDGAPMPERTQVTVNPTTGDRVNMSFGTIRYTQADAGKSYVYRITETGTVRNVENDTPRTVRVTVADNGNGTLTITRSDENNPVTFTNVYIEPEKITVSGSKTWIDRENQDGVRPEAIMIRLLENGNLLYRQRVTAESGWTWQFRNLEKYNENGEENVYTIEEEPIAGYTTVVERYNVTNIKTPDATTQAILKVWDDMENLDETRPAEIQVTLLADGTPVTTVTLNEANHWAAEVTGLQEKSGGRAIAYSWSEPEIPGYTGSVSRNGNVTVLTNSHTPELTEVTVRKLWNDNNNADGVRPASVIVTLSNGMSVTLTEANGWSATVGNLPVTKAGIPVVYTWKEHEVPAYTLTDTVTEGNVTTLTNTKWERPEVPEGEEAPKVPGKGLTTFEEYETPLGVEVMINHVGDCFD